jgi:quercetin dioxygenase-like cupin family protein
MTARLQGFCTGVLASVVVGGVALVATAPTKLVDSATSDAGKTSSRIVLENQRVRVKEVVFAPGVLDTGMHTHDLPHVGVILTRGTLVFTEPGGKGERVAFDVGSVGYRDANATHQVANPGPDPMRVIEVELK